MLQDEWSVFQGRKRDILLIYTHAHVWCASSIPRIPSSAPAILKSSSFFSLPSLVSLSTLAFCVLSRETSLPYACLFITCSAWTFPAPAPWQPSQSMEHDLFVALKLSLVPTRQKMLNLILSHAIAISSHFCCAVRYSDFRFPDLEHVSCDLMNHTPSESGLPPLLEFSCARGKEIYWFPQVLRPNFRLHRNKLMFAHKELEGRAGENCTSCRRRVAKQLILRDLCSCKSPVTKPLCQVLEMGKFLEPNFWNSSY